VSNPHDLPGKRGGPRDVAAALGISVRYVHKLVEQGKLGKGSDGQWNLAVARTEFAAVPERAGRRTAESKPESRAGQGLADAARRDKMASAKMRELKLRERTGELVERAAVRRLLVDLAKTTAGQLDSLEDELTSPLAAATDEHEVRRTLRHGLNRARRTIADAVESYEGHDGSPGGRDAYRAWLEGELEKLDE